MTAPLIPALAFAPLRAMAKASLTDTVTLETSVETRQPGGRIVSTWIVEDEQPCLYKTLSLDSPLRADQPSSARRGELVLTSGAAVSEGQRGLVRGETAGVPWQRLVLVEEVLHPKPHEIRRRALCSDVEASNPNA